MKPGAVLVALFLTASGASAQAPASQRMVVVISLDGFPANALSDSRLPAPTLRTLMRTGTSARMTTINPTVTWPNHTSMVTGVRADQHGLLANGTILRTNAWPPVRVEPMIEQQKMVHAPTVYEAAHRAGLTTAQVDWVAIEKAPAITWSFNEWATSAGPLEQEMIRDGVIAASELDGFTKANILFRDQIWTEAARYLIRRHKPNLLLLHFLSLDTLHHQYGPGSLAANAGIAFLDSCVARVVEAVHAAGMDASTTFLIVSDHGFKKYTRQVRPQVALAAAGLGDKVYVLAEGGTGYVYFDPAQDPALAGQVSRALRGVEGIDGIIEPDGFAALGMPRPERDPQMYRMLLTAKEGYSFSGATGGPVTAEMPQQAGSHGYLASDSDMDAIFIASGYGVQAGAPLGRVANVDVASTIAALLGVPLPTATGKALPLR